MKRNLTRTQKTIIAVIIVIAFIALVFYFGIMFFRTLDKNKFVNQAIQISDANENPVFKIKNVYLYSNADAIDNTENNSLKDLDISQYTDIAVSIDNTSYIQELTEENTVKAVRVDNIEILSDQPTGIKSLTYKSPYDFGKFNISDAAKVYTSTDNRIECAPIDYTVAYKNEEQGDLSKPCFYTDCSNPITLSYLNKDIVTHYSLPDNSNISFNGVLLRQANVDLVALTTAINFRITITNNLDENFVYNVKLNLNFDEQSGIITNGYLYQGKESSEGKAYDFFKDVSK